LFIENLPVCDLSAPYGFFHEIGLVTVYASGFDILLGFLRNCGGNVHMNIAAGVVPAAFLCCLLFAC
jgi:hypothetical protein